MGNYNPRQNTRMRWRDARELEKFIFLTGHFHFQTEVLENVLEDELYGKLYKELQFCEENITSKGVLITDTYNNALFIGTIFDDNSMQLINLYGNQADIIDINIGNENELNIKKETETFISEDNIKTLFGQSILGTGNIDLYRHYLKVSDNNGNTANFEFISSSNINATGSGTKLKDLFKCSGIAESRNYCYGFKGSPANGASLYWPGSATGVILLQVGSDTPSAVATVKDIVETI